MTGHAASDALRPGDTVGEFRIVREIGRGAMGIVYEAEQERLSRRVALKILPAALALDQRPVELFEREVEILGRLRHPNLVAVFDAGRIGDRPYYAMELVDGVNLAAVLKRTQDHRSLDARKAAVRELLARRAPQAERIASLFQKRERRHGHVEAVVGLGAKVADALAVVHGQGVMHRDIKPSNILVDTDREPRLVDFGLSRLADGSISVSEAQGSLMGTPLYMSPEQLLSGRVALDQRSDLYSLGATLYEMLTFRPPFAPGTLQALFRQIQWEDPPAMRSLDPQIPRDLEKVIATAMAKNPDHRYATATDLALDLRRVLAYDAVEARGPSRWSKLSRRVRRHRLRVAVVSVLSIALLAASAGALVVASRTQREERALAEGERHDQLRILGQAEGALEAGDVGRAMALADALASRNRVDTAVRARLDEVGRSAREFVAAHLEEARGAVAAERFDDAVSALAPLKEVPYRADETAALLQQSEQEIRERRQRVLFASAEASDRSFAVAALRDDVLAGRTPSAAATEAFERLLVTEANQDVMIDALWTVLVVGFDAYDARLLERYRSAPPEIAIQIAIAAAVVGRTSWLDPIRGRAAALGSVDWFDLAEWRERAPGRFGDVPDPLVGPYKTMEAINSWWTQTYHGASGTNIARGRALVLALRHLLSDRTIRPDLEAALGDPGRLGNMAIRILEITDDVSYAPAVAASVASFVDVDRLIHAAGLLARWGDPAAIEALEGIRRRATFDEDHVSAYHHVVGCFYGDARVQALVQRIVEDPFAHPMLVRATWTSFCRGPLATVAAGEQTQFSIWDPAWCAQPYRAAGLERDRPEVVARVRGLLSAAARERVLGFDPRKGALAEQVRAVEAWAKREQFWPLRRGSVSSPWEEIELAALRRSAKSSPKDLALYLDHPAFPVRREAALLLADAGLDTLAGGTLADCARVYGPDPIVLRAQAAAALRAGRNGDAEVLVRQCAERWFLPASLFEDPLFEPVRRAARDWEDR